MIETVIIVWKICTFELDSTDFKITPLGLSPSK